MLTLRIVLYIILLPIMILIAISACFGLLIAMLIEFAVKGEWAIEDAFDLMSELFKFKR